MVGGFVIYFLLGGAMNNDNTLTENNDKPSQIESKEEKNTNKDINIKSDDSMESVVVKKSIELVIKIIDIVKD